ncbi:hypothetical protein SARC_10219 [Sphaeroforma arctica JP610]|uniref:Spore coat protein CotH n=1 Tax=Sphaeroforma arctica JP610 TaxID=667725 RepID=A0A0L0FMQ7_9EUKA|nr:hypothetical protein SARC_10219 [Sphaeroforma arctica JP610]KNC77318.1 hypothetical protein SARC_10219 [Sphaeroforma arctica JP610]|eukprot:XP_014151220.1 hypothetical protein SARC_10219 [Sphaeroforma arctica JP610]
MKLLNNKVVVAAVICTAAATPTPLNYTRDAQAVRCVERGGWYYVENIPAEVKCISLDPNMYPRSQTDTIPRFRRGSGVFTSSIPIAPVDRADSINVRVSGYSHFHYDPTNSLLGELGDKNDAYVEGCDETNSTSRTSMKNIVCLTATNVSSIPSAISAIVTSFVSDLPIMTMTLTDLNNSDFGLEAKRSMVWSLHYPVNHTRHASPFVGILGKAEYAGKSSLEMSSKRGYSLSVIDAVGNDRGIDLGLAGMAPEADYKLRGTMLDKTLMKDMIGFTTYAATGRVSMKGAPIELYVRLDEKYADPNVVDETHYMGVYMLEEKIKRGDDRIPISKTKASTPINETSFIVKRDNFHEGDVQLLSGGSNTQANVMLLEYPKPDKATPAQVQYIQDYLETVDNMMKSPKMNDAFQQMIDVRSFVDQQLVQEMLLNGDAYRKSTTFYKDANGKFTAGPVWDFDLSLGHEWNLVKASSSLGYDRYEGLWFKELNQNPEYKCLVNCMWRQYRGTIFKSDTLLEMIDSQIPILWNPATRNFKRWDVLGRPLELFLDYTAENQWLSTWDAEVVAMKQFLVSRLTNLDSIYTVNATVCNCLTTMLSIR